MSIPENSIAAIVNRSASLYERLDGRYVPRGTLDEPKIDIRLQNWVLSAAAGDERKFLKRLKWIGCDFESARSLLGSVALVPSHSQPEWAETLYAFLQISETSTNVMQERFLDSGMSLPFESVLHPAVLLARSKLVKRSQTRYLLLSDRAHASLERNLLKKLASLCAPSFFLEFSIFRALRCSSIHRQFNRVAFPQEAQLFTDFCQYLESSGMLRFLCEYPVLGRLLATSIDQWVDAIAEFLLRLHCDWGQIVSVFCNGKDPRSVSDVDTGLADSHLGGRSVLILRLANGEKIVYKPRSVELENAFSGFLRWINSHQPQIDFLHSQLIERSGYGWIKFVEHLPCRDLEEVQRYFSRAGGLLCLLYILGATDCHQENVVATGEFPVLIDGETFLQPRPPSHSTATHVANGLIWRSVLRTLFLPTWIIDAQGNADLGGLGSNWEESTGFSSARWENVNKDEMKIIEERSAPRSIQHLPFLCGKGPVNIEGYRNDLIFGFRTVYRWLFDRSGFLLSPEGPISELRGKQVRFIMRPTRLYSRLLNWLLDPKFLRNGIDRSIEIDILARPLLNHDEVIEPEKLLRSEHLALERLDIPYFTAQSDGVDLDLENGIKIRNFFPCSGFSDVISAIHSLSPNDMELQCQYINRAFDARIQLNPHVQEENLGASTIDSPAQIITESSGKRFMDEALRLADLLYASAIPGVDGTVTWIGMRLNPVAERYQFDVLDKSLYAGTSGIALFLSAIAAVCKEARFESIASQVLRSLKMTVRENGKGLASVIGIGAFHGISGIAYALCHAGFFLNDDDALNYAVKTCSYVTPELISADQHFDLMLGAAGTILTQLAIYRKKQAESLLDGALQCGRHLLAHRAVASSGYRSWMSTGGSFFTGFSHGAAGIAYALLKLYEFTHKSEFLEAAQEALLFEDSAFNPARQNWYESDNGNDKQGSKFGISWCHGAPGIALGRLATLETLDCSIVRRDIEAGLACTRAIRRKVVDHLCCGETGIALILQEAGNRLKQDRFERTAIERAEQIVLEAKRSGLYLLFPNLPRGIESPGLMQGISGIGYGLLKLGAKERKIPSVLLLE